MKSYLFLSGRLSSVIEPIPAAASKHVTTSSRSQAKAFGGQAQDTGTRKLRSPRCFAGWRDRRGNHFRPGPGTFVWVAYDWPGTTLAGKAPARLKRNFGDEGDALGEYWHRVEIIWCMN